MDDQPFKLTHGSATLEKALAAANNVEAVMGRLMNGDRKALAKLSAEDLALLVQFVRNAAPAPVAQPGVAS